MRGDNNKCPICGNEKMIPVRSGNLGGHAHVDGMRIVKRGTNYNSCLDPICKEVAKKFRWRISLGHGAIVPAGYRCRYGSWKVGQQILFSESWTDSKRTFDWDWKKHKDRIQEVRREVMAIRYLNGQIKLTETMAKDVLHHINGTFCKPCINTNFKQFNYEKHKHSTKSLRNYGWSDLLLPGTSLPRGKSPKHAKHHQQG